MTTVMFAYDESTRKWRVLIDAKDEIEAKQAFNAVLITMRETFITMEHKTSFISDEKFELIPAV